MELEEIDVNFKVNTSIDKADICFHSVLEEPFKVYGVYHEDGLFRRLPESIAKSVNENIQRISCAPTGGRVRFKTNSPYVAIHAEMPSVGGKASPHYTFASSAGFDMYVRNGDENRFFKTFLPPSDMTTGYESLADFGNTDFKEITIHFPRCSRVSDLYIGLSNQAEIDKPEPYKIEKPIVFYGSSTTSGLCASRPGTDYLSILSRRFNVDYVNLGFPGNAMGEKELAEYIKDLDMSVFVLDYDYNAPNLQHLSQTHEPFFQIIREAQPKLPIVMLTAPKYYLNDMDKKRVEVIKTTYQHAVDRGDTNVYFIDGPTLMAIAKGDGTIDGCHPTDLGYYSMASAITEVLEKIYILDKN